MTSISLSTKDDRLFQWRLLTAMLFTAAAAFAAACMALASVHWSVKPVLSPWSQWIWPYVLYASASAIWIYLIAVPHSALAGGNGMRRALLTACVASVGTFPMLVLAGWLTRPGDPWLPVICMWTVAAAIAVIVGWGGRLSISAYLLIRLGLVVWLFALPAIALLDVGITTREFSLWGRLSPLYWITCFTSH